MTLLRPEEIARLKGLQVRARAVADGVFTGLHRAHHGGSSRDFSEHQEYAPGDDLRSLDWKAYARFDRPLVKRFESETERGCLLLVDASASMDYATGALSKLAWAQVTAAALAFVLLGQRDRVGLAVLGENARLRVPPRSRGDQLAALVTALEAIAPAVCPPTGLARAIQDAAPLSPRRGLVVLLSDLLCPTEVLLPALRAAATGRRELLVLQVMDPAELTFPFDGFRRFTTPERPDLRLDRDAREIGAAYRQALARHQTRIAATAAEAAFFYRQVNTREPPAQVLLDWAAHRPSHAGEGVADAAWGAA